MTVFRDNPELLREFRAGEPKALEHVYWQYVDVVSEVIRFGVSWKDGRRVAGVSCDEWSDLVQETFTRAFSERARSGYDGVRDYRPYVLTICRNLLADWARRRGREVPTDLLMDHRPDASQSNAPDGEDLLQPWNDPETVATVEAYIASLKPPLSDLYRERYVHGASQVKAAETLSLTRQRIRTLEEKLRDGLDRALAHLPHARRETRRG